VYPRTVGPDILPARTVNFSTFSSVFFLSLSVVFGLFVLLLVILKMSGCGRMRSIVGP
jgi:hypothetical protein